ncbi:MAG: hypothetical protein IJB98_00830 [Clostridia bacterium]|nr:hypothetical protein [Clostridia bacterium]
MTIKKFSIFTSIIVAIVLITSIVLSCVKVDNGLDIASPDKILIYKETSTALELTIEKRPGDYKKVKKLYNDMTNLSIMDRMLNSRGIKDMPGQDIDNINGTWKDSYKTTGYCIELIFDEQQSVVVSVDGNTKVLEFYGLIMRVTKTVLGEETAIYYSSSTGSSKSYNSNPILVATKQNKLYKFIDNLD